MIILTNLFLQSNNKSVSSRRINAKSLIKSFCDVGKADEFFACYTSLVTGEGVR